MSDDAAVRLRIREGRIGIRDARTRMPFRFGVVTMRAAPIATLELRIEAANGEFARGYAGDLLAYRWFDKRPEKSLADNVGDLLAVAALALDACVQASERRAASPFDLWWETYGEIERRAAEAGLDRLTAAFGASLVERAAIDAVGRLTGRPCADLVRKNALGIDPGRVFPMLAGRRVAEFLPAAPLEHLHVRHTVGLLDPISAFDRAAGSSVGDGLPETLEEYLRVDGLEFLKVKVGGTLCEDLARLEAIADLLARYGQGVRISLDGNEQFKDPEDFLTLLEALRSSSNLKRLHDAILFIEQPFDRAIAMDQAVEPAIRAIDRDKPVIIDESDGWITAFREAMELGYRGVSHKNCKGLYKSLLNLALAGVGNERLGQDRFFLSAEDLTNLPVVPLQADLAAVALLGIPHVERNGHHYFRGLGHLPVEEREAALARHPDLYERRGGDVFLRIAAGRVCVGSLQVPGMGFAAIPNMATMTPAEDWSFDRLGIGDAAALAR